MSEPESPFYSISTLTQKVADDRINKMRNSLQRIKAGDYGPSDYCRDYFSTSWELTRYYLRVFQILTKTDERLTIPVRPGDTRAVGFKTVGSVRGFSADTVLKRKDDQSVEIAFTAHPASDERAFVVVVENLPALASGQVFEAEVRSGGVEYDIVLEVS